MAKNNNDGENAGKSKKQTATSGVKSAVKPTKAESTASREPASTPKQTASPRARKMVGNTPQKDDDKYFVVFGQVMYADATPAAGLTVIAYDKDVSGKDTLGRPEVTTASGSFSIPYSEADFRHTQKERGGADVIVCVYNDKQELLFTSKKKNNAPEKYEMKIAVPAEQYVVRGTVTDANQKPLANMFVRAYERDLRIPQYLGAVETHESGEFRIAYSLADFQLGDAPSQRTPWLIVEVRASSDGEVLAKQEVQKAARDQTVSFTLASIGAVSEWQRISEAVRPLLKGQGSASIEMRSQVSDSKNRSDLHLFELKKSDVDFIVRETGLDAKWLALFVEAVSAPILLDGSESDSNASPTRQEMAEMLYGLLRAGAAETVNGLISIPRRTLQASLTWALDRRIVSAALEKVTVALLDEWDRLRAARAAERATAGQPFPVRAVLEPLRADLSTFLLERIQQMAARDGGLHTGLIDELEKDAKLNTSDRKAIPLLRTTMALANAVKGDSELLDALVKTLSSLPTITQPEHIVRMTHDDWLRVVETIKPVSGAGEGEPALSAAQRASMLMRQFDAAYLPEAAHLRVDNGELKLSSNAAIRLARLSKEHPEAKLGEGGAAAIAVALKKSDASAGSGLDADSAELLNLDAMLKACGTSSDVIDLQRAGFGSIQEVMAAGRNKFVKVLSNEMDEGRIVAWSKERANKTYENLNRAHDIGTIGTTGVAVKGATPVPAALGVNVTTLGGLTAEYAQCACETCRSVLSQSAYLADLLYFLHEATATQGRTPLEVLLDRRPDVQEILLDCTNETAELSYVDLVNEILERAVVSGVDPDRLLLAPVTGVGPFVAELNRRILPQMLRGELAAAGIHLSMRSYVQTVQPGVHWRVKDERWVVDLKDGMAPFMSNPRRGIRAAPWPQSPAVDRSGDSQEPTRVMAAYAVLADATYPWSLPFDYAHHATRCMLNARGVQEAELRMVFANGSLVEAARDAAVARLQLPERFLRDLASSIPLLEVAIAERWGFSSVTVEVEDPSPQYDDLPMRPMLRGWKTIAARLYFFVKRTGLSFSEVQSLLDTSFLNANGALTIRSTDTGDPQTCDIRKLNIDGLTGAQSFLSIERFIRLARASGLRFDELDVLLSSVGTGVWRTDIVRIAVALSIRDRLGLGNSEAAALWGPISTRSYSSASSDQPTSRQSSYDRVFRSSPALTALLPADPGSVSGWPTFEQLRAVLPDALSLESDGIVRWLSIAGLAAAQPSSLASLSTLCRHTLLARALGASVLEYQQFCSLTGEPPFSTSTPLDVEQVQRFVDRWSACRSLSPSLVPIVYILRPSDSALDELEARAVAGARELQSRLSTLWDQPAETRTDEITRSLAKLAGVDQAGAIKLAGRWLVAPADRTQTSAARRNVLAFLNDRRNWPAASGSPAVTAPIERSNAPSTISALVLIQKVGMLLQLLRVAPAHWEWLFGHASAAGWLDVNTLPTQTGHAAVPFDSLDRLAKWVRLANDQQTSSEQMSSLFTMVLNSNRSATNSALSAMIGVPVADVVALLGSANSTGAWNAAFPSDYWNPKTAMRLSSASAYAARLKVAPDNLAAWFSTAPLGFAERLLRADGIRSALLASLAESDRRLVQDEYRKQVSGACRTALVEYLLHRNRAVDSGELFAHYLIDVEMSVEQRSTRIAQAVLATQLFIQRSLMNLEPAVRLSATNASEWEQWRKWYRVWEANRRVFLYPENWLEPEFRDDKSPAFIELESELQQSDLSSKSAISAFSNYLDKLGQVSRLELVSILNSRDGDVAHLFARTRSSPVTHFYRQRIKGFRWSAWEKVESDIDGDFVIPIVQGNRLQVIWAVIKEEAQTTATATDGNSAAWKVQFARSRRTLAGWRPKEMIGQPFRQPRLPGKEASDSFAFRTASDSNNNVRVLAFTAVEGTRPNVAVPPATLAVYTHQFVNGKDVGNEYRWVFTFHFLYARRPDVGVPGLQVSAQQTLLADATHQTETTTVNLGSTDHIGDSRYYFPANRSIELLLELRHNGNVLRRDEWRFLSLAEDGRRTNYVGLGEVLRFHTGDYSGMTIPILVDITPPVQPNDPPLPVVWKNIPGIVCTPSGTVEPGVYDSNAELMIPPEAVPGGMGYKPKTSALHLSFNTTSHSVIDALSTKTMLLGSAERSGLSFRNENYFVFVDAHADLGFGPIFGLTTADGAYLGDITEQLIIMHDSAGGTTMGSRGSVRLESVHYPRDSALLSAWAKSQALCLPSATLQTAGTADDVSNALRRSSNTSVTVDFVPEGIEFDHTRPSSIYNWEIFLHIPWMIATRLSENKRYSEAQRWLHTIFDPTVGPNGTASSPLDAWRCRPLHAALQQDETLLDIMADQVKLSQQVQMWEEQPFQPHALARYRLRSYAIAVLKSYIENLIAWGDDIARRNTLEAVNEATQLYVLAASLLGERPGHSIQRSTSDAETFSTFSLQNDFDPLSNPAAVIPWFGVGTSNRTNGVPRFNTRYFCIPPNEMLLDLWARVEAGLQRVRSGAVGSLFGPPIDPALLVRAAAQGLDMAEVVAGLAGPIPPYRLTTTMQKASQLCGEVKALGSALLNALEKKDTEELSLLRSRHDHALAVMQQDIRAKQIREADAQIVTLRASRAGAVERLTHFRKLLNLTENPALAEGAKIARIELITALASGGSSDFDARQLGLSRREMSHLEHSMQANDYAIVASMISLYASYAHVFPNISWGVPPGPSTSFGGSNVGQALNAYATVFQALSADQNYQANRSSTVGEHERRRDEWAYQHNTIAAEIEQLDKQIASAQIHRDIASAELAYQKTVSENASEVEEFLKSKFSSSQLYHWMVRQLSSSYFRAYQIALELAKAAQAAFDRELLPGQQSQFIKAGYWDSLREGLLAGEQLSIDLARMEAEYLRTNVREIEITKNISLATLDPLALVTLRLTGSCKFMLPEVLFDLDFPGHYLRRIKSVAVSLPCIVGPYTSVSGTLKLSKSFIRMSPPSQPTGLEEAELPSTAEIVISAAQLDSGMFEASLRDERYLPFEGSGVVNSEWEFKLPSMFKPFDYESISDLVMQIRFTARSDDPSASDVRRGLTTALNAFRAFGETTGGLWRAFSLRHEFPSVWAALADSTAASRRTVALSLAHYGALFRDSSLHINEFKSFVSYKARPTFVARPTLQLGYKLSGQERVIDLNISTPVIGSVLAFQGGAVVTTANRPTINKTGMEIKLTLTGGDIELIEDLILCTKISVD